MKVTHHISTNIDWLLKMPDKKLGRLFDMVGADARRELIRRKTLGHVKIGSPNCEGFDPVKGCPGHPHE